MVKIENYILQEELARGSFGEVYKAIHASGDIVAIKKIKISQTNQNLLAYVHNEIEILSEISHPNILRFIKALKTTNHVYLVMELCEGGDLDTYLQFHKYNRIIEWIT